jgi:2-polyprenyl-3-methyl-5-hydroxy-6-metoxy-1,4-benzoquinol methylase
LCESKSVKKIFGNKNLLIQCRKCKFTFAGLEPGDQEIAKYYSNYHAYESLSPLIIKRYNIILDKLEKYRQTNNLLETGCGNGIFLEVARKRNWNVFGTEYSDAALDKCAIKNLPVSKSLAEIKLKAGGDFDVVVTFEVIEHLKNPVQEIIEYSKLLRKNGGLYATTPNYNSLSRRILGYKWNIIIYPEHLSYFTPHTLNKLLSDHGFKKIESNTSGVSFGRLVHSLRHKTKNPSTEIINYDYNEKDRKLINTIENNYLLRFLKSTVNSLLSFFHAGDSLKVLYEKK